MPDRRYGIFEGVACPDCEGPLALTHRREQDVKCERFTASFQCGHYSYANEASLCLPLLA